MIKKLSTLAMIAFVLGPVLSPPTVSAKSSSSKKDSDSEKDSDSKDEKSSSSNDEDDSDEKSDDSSDKSDDKSDKEEKEDTGLTADKLASKLGSIISSVSSRSDWGVKVMLAETGQTLFESKADQSFIPASNRKLFTAALALDQLGPDYKFRTYLYKTGNVDAKGVLHGNLVIVPSGDPTFSKSLYKASTSDWVYRDWAAKVKEAGITYVTGDMLIDCSTWDMNDMTPKGWPKRMVNDSYAPQTSPLTINENITNIFLTPGKSGEPASVSFSPSATGYPVVNNTKSGQKGSPLAKRIVGSHIEITGGVPSKKTIWSFPIDRPTLYSAANFRSHLMDNKIPIQGSIRIITAQGALPGPNQQNTLALVESPKLIDIMDYMMKRSDNHMAEQIYVAVSQVVLGKGSYGNSSKLEAQMLTRAQIDPRNVHCYDGCGLSEDNRVTPDDVCKLLIFMRHSKYAQEYYNAMAISGRDGTLRNRMGRIAGKVHAKTGTINGVKTLSGYLMLSPDKTISFSFLVNQIRGGSVSGIQDRLCTTIATLVL